MHSFEFEWQPDTEPKGVLGPPRRRPPTAVGVGGSPPRPPEEPDDSNGGLADDGAPYREPSLVRRIGLALLAMQVLVAALVLLEPLGWRAYLGAGVAALSQIVWRQARARTVRELRTLSSSDDGESHLRSA